MACTVLLYKYHEALKSSGVKYITEASPSSCDMRLGKSIEAFGTFSLSFCFWKYLDDGCGDGQ